LIPSCFKAKKPDGVSIGLFLFFLGLSIEELDSIMAVEEAGLEYLDAPDSLSQGDPIKVLRQY